MFQGCFAPSKWGNQRKLQKWDKFVQFAPKLARMRMEVPNKLRPLFGITKMKHTGSRYPGKDSIHSVPDALCQALKTLLAERIVAGEEVTVDVASSALECMIRKWNVHFDKLRSDVQEKIGGEILQEEDFELAHACSAVANAAEERAVAELERRLQQMGLRRIAVHLTHKNLQKIASKCCQKVGVYKHCVNKQSKHLETDHPAMEEVRAYVRYCVRFKGVHERLIANFDQVWCLQYEPPRAVLGISDRRPRNANNTNDKEMVSIRQALSLSGESEPPSSRQKREPAEAPCLNPQGKVQPVEYGRLARTTTTLSWSDGTMGRAFVTAAAGSVCSPQIFLCTHLHCD
jgi:hypothetical protein